MHAGLSTLRARGHRAEQPTGAAHNGATEPSTGRRASSGITAAVSLPSTLLKGNTHASICTAPANEPPRRHRRVGGAHGRDASAAIAAHAASPPPAHLNNTVGPQAGRPHRRDQRLPALVQGHQQRPAWSSASTPSDANCIMGDLPNPGQPVSFPDNFPDEGVLVQYDRHPRRRRRRQGAAGHRRRSRLRHCRRAAGPRRPDQLRPDPDPGRRPGRRSDVHRHEPVRRRPHRRRGRGRQGDQHHRGHRFADAQRDVRPDARREGGAVPEVAHRGAGRLPRATRPWTTS